MKLWHDFRSEQYRTTVSCGTVAPESGSPVIELKCLPARNVRISGSRYAFEEAGLWLAPLPPGVPAMHYTVYALSRHGNLISCTVWGESLAATESLVQSVLRHDPSF